MRSLIIVIVLQLSIVGTGLCADQKVFDDQDMQLFEAVKQEQGLNNAQTYELLGRIYLNQEKWEKAVASFNEAVRLDPKLYLSWYNLGLLHMDNPELYFKKAIEADSKFAPSYYWLALYYYKQGRATESVEYFEGYLKVVNKNDAIEKDRIKAAGNFIKEIKEPTS